KLLADQPVDRIGAAAANGNNEADGSNQQHIFVSAAAGRITPRQMHEQQGYQHLSMARAAAKKRVNRPMIRQTPPTDSRNMMTYAHSNAGSMPFFAKILAATAVGPDENLPDTCIRNMIPTTMRTKVAAIGSMVS